MSSVFRLPRKFVQITSIVTVPVFLCLSFLFCFGGEKDKFSRPSKSSRSAKWRGVHLRQVELSPVEPDAKMQRFSPNEAWLEAIYENNESMPLMRKKTAGVRLCVRFEYSLDGVIHSDTKLLDLDMTINGISPTPQGGVWDATGVTFSFPPDLNGEFTKQGELTFSEKTRQIESKFRYLIK